MALSGEGRGYKEAIDSRERGIRSPHFVRTFPLEHLLSFPSSKKKKKKAKVLSSLSHRNIVQFFGAVTKSPNYCIVTGKFP